MKQKLSDINFQPFTLFGNILERTFVGYSLRRPYYEHITKKDDIRFNHYRPCDPISHNSMMNIKLSDIIYGVSKVDFLKLKAGDTYIEIYVLENQLRRGSDQTAMINFFCFEKANNPIAPETINIHVKILITKLEDEVFVAVLERFMRHTFPDPTSIKEWINLNVIPMTQ
jgi:hypothetical protein